MIELVTIRRVTIYTSSDLEENLIKHCLSLGATGYTVTSARGKGEHGVIDDLLSTRKTHSRIELIVQPDVATKIMMFLQADHLKNQAVTACLEDVQVSKTEHF